MNVIVFGATGQTGRHACRRALRAGHQVTAFGRSVDRLAEEDPAPAIVRGDALDPSSVADAVAGHDAAIVCLGSTGLRDATTLSTGTSNVVSAMTEHGGGRLVVLSAAGVGASRSQVPWSSKLLFSTILRTVMADHERQETIVEQSSLDWTIVRAGVLKDGPAIGDVTATKTGRITKITRADVADFLVAQLDDPAHLRAAISVTS